MMPWGEHERDAVFRKILFSTLRSKVYIDPEL